ncbi:MAG: hypothetical protein C5B51_22840 [Terriglobia bacterium]|nr:MAG: hypothetical protein C5B51_22840 [Terriglobia bacterium]
MHSSMPLSRATHTRTENRAVEKGLRRTMPITTSQNELLVRWLIEQLFNRKRTGVADFLYARDCHGYTPDGWFTNRKEFLAGFANYAAAFPAFRVQIDYLAADLDWVLLHYTFTGVQTGTWAGLNSKGQAIRITGMMNTRIVEGRIVQQDFVWDAAAVRRQLQAEPAAALDPGFLRVA